MLKPQITKAEYDALEPRIQSEYKQNGSNFVLDIVGDVPEVAALRSDLVARATSEAQLRSQVTDLTAQLETATADATKEVTTKLEKAEAELNTLRTKAAETQQKAQIDQIANKFTNPELFAGALASRVRTTVDENGDVVTKYYDAKGEETTFDKLHDEYLKNPSYSGMLSKSSTTVTTPQSSTTPVMNNGSQPKQQTSNVKVNPTTQKLEIDYSKATDAEIAAAYEQHYAQQQQ